MQGRQRPAVGISLALSLLVAEPDDKIRAQAVEFFKGEMYNVVAVSNGKDAQKELYNASFFAIVINYELQNHSSLQVLRFLKSNHPNMSVVMYAKSEEQLNEDGNSLEKLEKLGAREVILGQEVVFKDIQYWLEGNQGLGDIMSNLPKRDGPGEEENVDMSDEEFTKVKIGEFFSSKAVLFDVYIRLGSGKYLKILHMGDAFSQERLDRYRVEKKVEYLHFRSVDRRKFLQFSNHLIGKTVENKNVQGKTKLGMFRNISEKFLEEVSSVGMKPQAIDQGKEICRNIYRMIETQDDLHSLLRNMHELDPTSVSHSFLVTVYSTAIIKQFDWQSKATIESTAFACLIHDLGKLKLGPELMLKRPSEMSEEELELYKEHPRHTLEMVENNRMVNNSVKQMVLQHHEYYNGTGFPGGVKGSKILTLSNIICLADIFAHLLVEEELAPTDALKRIVSNPDMVSRFNSLLIEKFINVFVDPEKIRKEMALPSNSKMVPKR